MRRVCYVSGTRADFGLIERTLIIADKDPALEISVCVTGMHLSALHGETVREVEKSGLRICARIPVDLRDSSGASMAKSIGQALVGLVDALSAERPQLVMVLGDRGEMLAGALAAIHLGIPVVHVHGGERTGTVDEPIRHAISKLAHVHLVSTAGARERLLRMGERPDRVLITGAPGLDGLRETRKTARNELCREQGFDPARPVALVIFHPVLQEAACAGRQMAEILAGALGQSLQILCFAPNSDAGAAAVRQELAKRASHPDVRVVEHFARERFVSWMAAADVMVGNSSAGIIEAASLGLPVVNVGSRQKARERSGNVIDVEQALHLDVGRAIARSLAAGRSSTSNVYGDGKASGRIAEILASFPFDASILQKTNAY